MTVRLKHLGALAALALVSLPAMAHPGHDHGTGFLAGFIHPFTGIDHLLAMLGVGIWGAQQRRGLEQPLTFLAMMLIGALAGMAGLGLPGLEMGIAATVALTGLAIALALSMPGWLAMGLVGVFALAHGNAHGQELSALPATCGFMLASAILLLSGRFIGQMLAERVVRVAGAAITAVGLVLMGMN
ncbi:MULTISPECIES: HupE/UreJ family protein [unclassified Janthinobacterium]|uniref:HupE/UreJ family protein n=1 Tax=unclassified Janthinobacterium TaxID=2610881 RepID=UPI0016100B43|nr:MULTISPECIES: HupE/UreJ family protein [unclassified Janthinobacterium]MBB5368787.1 urease accessory protein [Janthinobacterium sp. K2C7]MBB5381677.1 urease accessory protein [Janthinobacterium sp. K2Li3]MBB5387169.1 urease accessory protein [Janthinobacterium sp. K2E3]